MIVGVPTSYETRKGTRKMITQNRIPLAVKLAYTVFVAILVPNYWLAYSPWTFLYFCDVALLLTLPALWLESALLLSLPAVGITLPQLLWVVDFLTGTHITGMTSYMFDPKLPLFVRGLSTFHGWLPFLLVWGVWRLGYDRRALVGWTVDQHGDPAHPAIFSPRRHPLRPTIPNLP